MKDFLLKLYFRVQVCTDALARDESGQDLIEYALVVAMIGLGATASIQSLSSSFSTAFSKIGSKLSTYSS